MQLDRFHRYCDGNKWQTEERKRCSCDRFALPFVSFLFCLVSIDWAANIIQPCYIIGNRVQDGGVEHGICKKKRC